jgi:hypothetical protein
MLLHLTLFDKSILDLEALFTDVKQSQTGLDLENMIHSTAVHSVYRRYKPLAAGTRAQDIADKSFRPFVRVIGPSANGSIRVRSADDDDDRRAYDRDPSDLISGLPVVISLSVASPPATIRRELSWLWPRGHIPPDEILVRRATTTATTDIVDAFDLLAADPTGPPVRLALSRDPYVPGSCAVAMAGAPVRVLVRQRDAVAPAAGRLGAGAFLAGGGAGRALVVAAGLGFVCWVLFDRPGR